MNILDSSGWIEVFQRGPNFDKFIKIAKDLETLLLPTIVIYEVVKYMTIWGTEDDLEECIHTFHGVTTVPLTDEISYSAVEQSRKYKLPLADSIIYATAQKMNATLWTQDKHFKDIEGVKYFSKP